MQHIVTYLTSITHLLYPPFILSCCSIVTLRTCTVKSVSYTPDGTTPTRIDTAKANAYNKQMYNICSTLDKLIDEILTPGLLLSVHADFTPLERAVSAMNVERPSGGFHNKRAKRSHGFGSGSTIYIMHSCRALFEYIHFFKQNLQELYDSLSIIGTNIDGSVAHDCKQDLCHTTHIPVQRVQRNINGTLQWVVIDLGLDINPKNTYFANRKVNMSSYRCSQNPWDDCSCIGGSLHTPCHDRAHLLTREFWITTSRESLLNHLSVLKYRNQFGRVVAMDERRVCLHFLLKFEARLRSVDPTTQHEWIETEKINLLSNPPVLPPAVLDVVTEDRKRAYALPMPDANLLHQLVLGDHLNDGLFNSRLEEQTRLLELEIASRPYRTLCSIQPGTSFLSGTLTKAKADNENRLLDEMLVRLHSFFTTKIQAGRITDSDPRLSLKEHILKSWSMTPTALRNGEDSYCSQRIRMAGPKKQVTTMMKLFQLYVEDFHQDIVLMRRCLAIQGNNITGREAYLQKKNICHHSHTHSRSADPRDMTYASHLYNMSQMMCGYFPWKLCRCRVKCHPRLHELTQARFEREIQVLSASRKHTSSNRHKTVDDIRRSLATEFKDAFERVDGAVDPAWIVEQISNPGPIALQVFQCGICDKCYPCRVIAEVCSSSH